MELQRRSGLHPVHAVLLLGFLVGAGWFAGFLYQGGGRWLADAARLAYMTQFQVRSGLAEGARTYYVSSSDSEALLAMLEREPGVASVEPTFIDDLLIVAVSDPTPDTFNRLRGSPLVSVITTVPLFCH